MPPSSSLYQNTDPRSAPRSAYLSHPRPTDTPQAHLPPSATNPYRQGMSGFLSSEAERALEGEEAEAQRLFYESMMHDQQQARRRYPPSSSGGYPSPNHPGLPYIQQPTWSSNYNPAAVAPYPAMQHAPVLSPSPYVVPSSSGTSEWSRQSWKALRPEEAQGSRSRAASGSDYSRSSSPNPAELHNFGYPLPDGRSWRCKHPGCTSPAVFTRGCDLRKHFRRHTKSLFCRHEDCPQSTEGGFSSKKDRLRHEAKHKPGVPCEWDGCERVFSRVDNMKDHVRRIHRKSS